MRPRRLALVLAVLLLAGLGCDAAGPEDWALQYDVVVVGGGTGGTAAALEAARSGARVLVVEEARWLGGQMTSAGVSTMDEAGPAVRRSGLYAELHRRVVAHYAALGKSTSTCYWSGDSFCAEPRVAAQVLAEMVAAEPGITLALGRSVRAVLRDGNTAQGVRLDDGREVRAPTTIDATEYGDVVRLSGAPYRVGNRTASGPAPDVDGDACVQDVTVTAEIKRYPGGVPRHLLMSEPPPGYDRARGAFRDFMSATGGHFPATRRYPVGFASHNAYRGLPDSAAPGSYTAVSRGGADITRTSVNWANDFPALGVGSSTPRLSLDFLLDEKFRARTVCEAKLRTLQFLYYVQQELGHTDWSLADDAGFDASGDVQPCAQLAGFGAFEDLLPRVAYVRESVRVVGVTTITAGDIERTGTPAQAQQDVPSSIAVGHYPVDLHNCKKPDDLEPDLESLADVPPGFVGGPFEVPLEALVPRDVDGLLAAEKNLSSSRLANGALRLQPITMLTGQAAGALAAAADRLGVPARDVPVLAVQLQLAGHGVVLARTEPADVPAGARLARQVQVLAVRGLLDARAPLFRSQEPVSREDLAQVVAELEHAAAGSAGERRPAGCAGPTCAQPAADVAAALARAGCDGGAAPSTAAGAPGPARTGPPAGTSRGELAGRVVACLRDLVLGGPR